MSESGLILGKKAIRNHVEKYALQQGWTAPVLQGLVGNDIASLSERRLDYLCVDHSYFKRGWERYHFRLTRGWYHLTTLKKRPDDRLRKFGVQIEPWRKAGGKVVVIPPTEPQQKLGSQHWTKSTVDALSGITGREIVVKWEKGGLREFLADAWAVVTWASVAGVEAALMGVPVFASEHCPAYPVTAGSIEQIETPYYAENRHEWACSLAYASWHTSEIPLIRYADYDYSLRDDVP